MILSGDLRSLLQFELGFKFKANDCIRNYLKQDPSFADLLLFIKKHKNCKRDIIPSNMHYNRYVKKYWKDNPQGTHKQCVQLWHLKYKKIYYSSA